MRPERTISTDYGQSAFARKIKIPVVRSALVGMIGTEPLPPLNARDLRFFSIAAKVRLRGRDEKMKRKRFSEEQIIGILKEAEAGAIVTELCGKHGLSSATYYAW